MKKQRNRYELKYLVSLRTAWELKKYVQNYACPDSFGDASGSYTVTSLYYDSPGHRCYWEKIDGVPYRRKLRIRWYETVDPLTDDSPVFVEIKQRIDRSMQKKRLMMSCREAFDFCDRGIMPRARDEDRPLLDEMYSLLKVHALRSTLVTTCRRQAFVGTKYDKGLRVTFDSDSAYRIRDLRLDAGTRDGYIVPPHLIIMEIKTDNVVPYWITEMIDCINPHPVRISKYCSGMDRAEALIHAGAINY